MEKNSAGVQSSGVSFGTFMQKEQLQASCHWMGKVSPVGSYQDKVHPGNSAKNQRKSKLIVEIKAYSVVYSAFLQNYNIETGKG